MRMVALSQAGRTWLVTVALIVLALLLAAMAGCGAAPAAPAASVHRLGPSRPLWLTELPSVSSDVAEAPAVASADVDYASEYGLD